MSAAPDSSAASLPKLICILGPTGTGKSAAALHLAKTLGGGIINADSRQVYADFPLITAQPDSEERAQCPHLLYGFLETRRSINAGQWLELALAAIAELQGLGSSPKQDQGQRSARGSDQDQGQVRGLVPLLTGGTGLYVRALVHGMAQIPPTAPDIVQRLEREYAELGAQAMHMRLAGLDPAYAARTHANNRQRVLRALAVCESSGRAFSDWHASARPRPSCRALCIGLRARLDELGPRLARRIEKMLDAGALDEARRALERCPDPAAPGWSGIGCAELRKHLCEGLELTRAQELWYINTRHYAKRQLTWFGGQPDLLWMDADDFSGMEQVARAFLAE